MSEKNAPANHQMHSTLPVAAKGIAPGELVLKRTFNAPREVVFDAWTDPNQVAKWWGPKGFTNPRCEIDARVGGIIHIDMRGPDGVVYPMEGVFKEIERPKLLVFLSVAQRDANGNSILEVFTKATFEEVAGKTELTVYAIATKRTPEAEPAVAGMHEGWSQTLDRLEDYITATNK